MSEKISIGNAEDKKLKHKMEENSGPRFEKVPIAIPSSSQPDVEDIDTPKLNICTKSTSKPLEIGEHSSSSQNATGELSSQNTIGEPIYKNANDELLPEQEVRDQFPCHYCDKKFSSPQALGGHQNAHKSVRDFKKLEAQRREDEIDSIIASRSYNQTYPYSFSSPHYHGYSYFRNANFSLPINTHMNNTMTSGASGSLSSGYGGLYMPNTTPTSSRFVMQMPNSSLATSQLGMTDFWGGNQNVSLPISQRSNTFNLGLFPQANQTPSTVEGANTTPALPRFVMQIPNSSLATPQFGMTNFQGGNQNAPLPISQRSNTLSLGFFPQANQTPSTVEGAHTTATSPRFVMQMPNSSLATPQFGMTNFLSGNQNASLPISQRSTTLGLGLFPQANQTPSIVEGATRNVNAQVGSRTLQLLPCDSIGEESIQTNSNASLSSTQSSSEEINLDLTL